MDSASSRDAEQQGRYYREAGLARGIAFEEKQAGDRSHGMSDDIYFPRALGRLDAAVQRLDRVGHRERPARASLAGTGSEAGEVRGNDFIMGPHEGGYQGGIGPGMVA